LVKFAEAVYLDTMCRRFGSGGELALAVLMERVRVARAAASNAARHGVTHVHCHDPLLARAYAFFAPLYGATGRWGYSAHAYGRYVQLRLGMETSKNSLASLQRWENQAARKASWVIAPSRSGLEQMARDLSFSTMPSRWHMVPHAVTKPLACDRIAARNALGVGENEKLLVAVGQLIPLKRFSLLLESIALLPAELRPRLLILGEGGEHPALQALADKLGLASRFEIRMTDNIGQYLAAADIYASVSSTESYGIANCEALLAGIPSVCTAVGAVPEVLGEGALLVGEKPEQIASALAMLLTSSEEQQMLVAKSKIRVAEWLGPEEVALALENIYAGGNYYHEHKKT
jgi:glycosyltransferase involved in cell wall biosynthesis